jgi:glycosyltransferase involved in cell wall biosynthesis
MSSAISSVQEKEAESSRITEKNPLHPRAKILFVDNDVNSFYSYRVGVACAARDAGFEVHVAAPRGKAVELLEGEGFVFHAISMTRRGTMPWKEVGTILALAKLYRSIQPDLVHLVRLKPVLYGGLAAHGARVPAVVNLLTGLGYVFTGETRKAGILRKIVSFSCKVAFRHKNQRVIFQNPDDRAVFVNNRILPMQQTVLIKGSGVDIEEYRPVPEPVGVPVVLLGSRMLRDKGITDFVEAAGMLKKAGVQARFVLVGDTDPGNPTAISEEQLQDWASSGAVEWWGHQNGMHNVLTQAHIVCLPSYREGVPKVLIEAAACGRPIVTTDAPGCREIVRHGENGLLVPVRNSQALAEALRTLIENPALRMRMGSRGREIVVQEFSLARVVDETLRVYRDLLAAIPNYRGSLTFLEQKAQ